MQLRVVCAFAEENQKQYQQFRRHLKVFERQGIISVWGTGEFSLAEPMEAVTMRRLEEADIIILLISPDFLASDYLHDEVLARALRRQGTGDVRVVPILIKPVDVKGSVLGTFSLLPSDGRPVSNWPDADEAYFEIISDLRGVFAQVSAAKGSSQFQDSPSVSADVVEVKPDNRLEYPLTEGTTTDSPASTRSAAHRPPAAPATLPGEQTTPASLAMDSAQEASTVTPSPKPEHSPRRRVGRSHGATNDTVAREDQLGFVHYVEAFARLITAPDTTPPLTIGIYGAWGMGKSFLLKHIVNRVKNLPLQPDHPRIHAVEFNAWEYSAVDKIWPALVRRIMEQILSAVRWRFRGHRSMARFVHRIWHQLSTGYLIFAIGVSFFAALIAKDLTNDKIKVGLWSLAGLFTLAPLAKSAFEFSSSSLSRRIGTLLHGSDYGGYTELMAEIRSDLAFLSHCLRRDQGRALIIIDDLDRCEPQKAVEVLQAINLLLTLDNFLVLLGIDARIITQSIEGYYKGMLGAAGGSGYEYLDKIVQLPFRIPPPRPEDVSKFLEKLLGGSVDQAELPVNGQSPTKQGGTIPLEKVQSTQAEASRGAAFAHETRYTGLAETSTQVDSRSVVESAFTGEELSAFRNIARFLRPNPRHVKRLVNVYRLVRTLGEQKQEPLILDSPAIIIRLLALCGQWPYTGHAMLYVFDEMLERLEEGRPVTFPDGDILRPLFEQASKHLKPEKQAQLDHDRDILRMMLFQPDGHLTWQEMRTLRQYTVNFNPAIEFELRAELLNIAVEGVT